MANKKLRFVALLAIMLLLACTLVACTVPSITTPGGNSTPTVSYKVNIHSDGQADIAWDRKADFPALSKEHYNFEGLYLDAEFTKPTSIDDLKAMWLTGDINVYVNWTKILYTITVHTANGEKVTWHLGEDIPSPTREGYVVGGFYFDKEFTQVVNLASLLELWENKDVYVKWVECDHKAITEWTIDKNATCTEEGHKHATCPTCGQKGVEDTIPALGHTYGEWQKEIPATCASTGIKGHKDCTICKKHFDENNVEIADLTIAIDPNNHDIQNHAGQPATCKDAGWEAYETCSRCEYTTYSTISALGHDEVNHAGQSATCTADGWEAYVTCSRCDYTTYQKIDALGHDEVEHAGQFATCTEDGWEAYVTCSRCDYTTYQKIDALGHSMEHHDEADATCDKDGNIEYWYCSGCETYFADEEGITTLDEEDITIESSGHSYGAITFTWNANYTSCTATRVCIHDATHIETAPSWSVTSNVTQQKSCTNDQLTTYTAEFITWWVNTPAVAKDIITEYASGHSYGTLIAEAPAKCEETGVKAHYQCSVCEEYFDEQYKLVEYSELIIPVTGHSYGDWIDEVPATCVKEGTLGHYHCECGKNFDENYNEIADLTIKIPEAIDTRNHKSIVSYEWTQDTSGEWMCTAYFKCGLCEYHEEKYARLNESITTLFKTEKQALSCTQDGIYEYKTNFNGTGSKTWAEEQTKIVTIDAPGHDMQWVTTGKTQHWKECSVCHTVNETTKAEHVWKLIETITEAQEEIAGWGKYQCEGCDATKEDVIAALKHTHTFDDTQWSKNDNYHWHPTSCGHDTVENKDCAGYAEHSYTDTVTAPTCTEQGYTTHTCACGYAYVDSYVNALDHNYGAWVSNGDGTHTKTCLRDTSHTVTEKCSGGTATCIAKAICSTCGNEYGTLKAHVYDQKNTDSAYLKSAATCTAKAVYYYSCSCGAKGTATFEYGEPKAHTYDQKVTESKYLASDATCTAPAKYYYSCTCGEKGTETFEHGTALGHTYDQKVTDSKYLKSDATCTAKAVYYYSCSCGASSKGTTSEKTFEHGEYASHTLEEVKATPATCQETGIVAHYHCSVCEKNFEDEQGETELESIVEQINKNNHYVVNHPAKAPTCTEVGWNAYVTCSRCDYTTKVEIPANGHSYTDTVTAPTCTEQGYTTHTCACGDTYVDTYVDASGHTGGTATCTAKAICSTCSKEYGDLAEHTYVYDAYKSAGCYEDGCEEHYHCSVCNKNFDTDKKESTKDYIIPKGHGEKLHFEKVDATCTKDGCEEYWMCKKCNSIFKDEACTEENKCNSVDDLKIGKLGHNSEGSIAHKDATCTEAGVEGGTYCTHCNDGKAAAEATIGVLGHDEENHSEKAPTCTEAGWEAYVTCSHCDYTTYKKIEAKGHSYGELIAEVPATDSATGVKAHYACTNDGCTQLFDINKNAVEDSKLVIAIGEKATYTSTIVIADYAKTNSWENGGKKQYESLGNDVFTATISNKGSNSGKYYSDWRIYQSDNSSLVISPTKQDVDLLNIKITFGYADKGTLLYNGEKLAGTSGKESSVSVTGTDATFTVGATSGSSGKIKITQIQVEYSFKSAEEIAAEDLAKAKEAVSELKLDKMKTAYSATGTYDLPTTNKNGATVTWSVDNNDYCSIIKAGSITEADKLSINKIENQTITLSVAVKVGTKTVNETVDITISAAKQKYELTITEDKTYIVIEVKDAKGAIVSGGTMVEEGTELTITVTNNDSENYAITKVLAGTTPLSANEDGTYSFTMTEATTISVETKEILNTPQKIVDALYALGSEESLEGTYELTGKITSIDTIYSSEYGNITVTIANIEGVSDATKTVQCFRLKGDNAKNLMVNDIITVSGTLTHYSNGTKEFAEGCTIKAYAKGTSKVTVSAENATVTFDNGIEPDTAIANGTTVQFAVSANTGYELVSVKAGSSTIEQEDGKYSITLDTGDVAITVATKEEGAAEPIVVATALFGSSYDNAKANNYTSTWTATNGDYTWTIVNFNNNNKGWEYIKCGSKKATSVATITNGATFSQKITKVVIDMVYTSKKGTATAKLKVNSTNNFDNVTGITFTPVTSTTLEILIPEDQQIALGYYQLEFDCAKGGDNGCIQINSITYYA